MSILALAVGYCAAVIFPVPFASQAVLNGWGKVGSFVMSKLTAPKA